MMESRELKILIFASLLIVTSAKPSHGQDNAAELSEASNCFTWNMYKLLTKSNENLITSPFSLDVLLSVLRTGAGGKTANELTTALGYTNLSVPEMKNAFQSKLSKLTSSDNTLEVANSVWIQNKFNVEQSFKDTVAKKFYATIDNVDFADPQTTSEINSWGNDKTHGLIPTLFNSPLDPSTVMVLVNALYFKGEWASKFKTEETKDGNFNNNDLNDEPSTVKLMHQERYFKYSENPKLKAQILEMPYKGEDMSMIIILPQSGSNMQKLEEAMTCQNFKSAVESGNKMLVDVTMPKFDITSDFNLKDPITAMNMNIFDSSADFSGIAPGIAVTTAIQKAIIKVYEEGSEAAALTRIPAARSAMADPEPSVVYFKADHPFLFMIRHNPTNLILFIGGVKNL